MPTTAWPAGATSWISGLPISTSDAAGDCLTLQMYDAGTLEKLPVSHAQGVEPMPAGSP